MTKLPSILAILAAAACTARAAEPGAPVDFVKQILPIFEHKCFACHSSETKKPKGDLKLDDAVSIKAASGLELIVPGQPDKSALVHSITLPPGDDDIMPPAKESSPLTKAQVQLVRDWIAQGAQTGSWVKYEKQVAEKIAVSPAEAKDTRAAAAKIDALLDAALAKQGTGGGGAPAPEDVWMRRVYLDLIGRNPTFDEARAFLQNRAADKRAKLIDMLLASEGYVSRHFNYFADALRAKSSLGDGDGGPSGAAYMAWVKEALRTNQPFDQLVREILTARGRLYETPQAGFFMRDDRNKVAGVENLSAMFLGEQIGCAMCHDHPYDTWTRKDFYAFAAFTLGVHSTSDKRKIFNHVDGELIDKQTNEAKHLSRMRRVEAGKEDQPAGGVPAVQGSTVQGAKVEVADPKTGQVKMPRVESAPMMSDAPSAEESAEEKTHFTDLALRERLVKEVRGVDFGNMTYSVLSHGVGRQLNNPDKTRISLPKDYQYKDAKPGDLIKPAVLFGETPPLEGRNPTHVLAEWLTAPENPRFALVAANRLWNKTFGWSVSGPVADVIEPEKGGAPALARYFEALFRATGHDIKQFLRILSHTQAYQRTATVAEANDLEGRIFPAPLVRRLNAEQVWDSLVSLIDPAVDARLDKGPEKDGWLDQVRNVKTTEEYWHLLLSKYEENKAKGQTFVTRQNRNREIKKLGFDDDALRRASELPQPSPDGHFLRIFGQSNRLLMDNAWANPTVPQALTLMNGPLFTQITKPDSTLNRTLAALPNPEAKCSAVFLATVGRVPTAAEVQMALADIRDGSEVRYEDLAWALINSRQFLFQH